MILQESTKHHLLFKKQTTQRSWKLFQIHKYTLSLQIDPWKESAPCNWVPKVRQPVGTSEFCEVSLEFVGEATAEDHMQKGFEWWPEMGRGQRRRARTADSGSGGRRSGCSGVCSAET
jgi:hypothetical protein